MILLAVVAFLLLFFSEYWFFHSPAHAYSPLSPSSTQEDCDCEDTATIFFLDNGDMALAFPDGDEAIFLAQELPPEWKEEDKSFLEEQRVRYVIVAKIAKEKLEFYFQFSSNNPKVQKLLDFANGKAQL